MSNAAVVVSVAAVALLFVALAATLLIAWRRRRADRSASSKVGTTDTAAGPTAPGASLSLTEQPGSASITTGSPTAGVATGADATPLSATGPGPWAAPWPPAWERWERTVRHEDDRLVRYPHRVAVAIAELDGVDIVVDRYGRPAEERLARAVEDTLRRCARDTDAVARIGRRRFAVLLVEADDAGAERYAHRLRLATELWLEAVALPLRMRIAVAGPPIGGTLAAALEIAETRLSMERAMLDHEHDGHEAHPTGRRSPGGVR